MRSDRDKAGGGVAARMRPVRPARSWQADRVRSLGDHSIAEADLAISRRANFWILPVEVLGSTQNSMNLGTL